LSSEMSKHKEALEDCLKYKKFLDMLTPPEWFQNHERSLIEERNRIQKERFDKKYKEWERDIKSRRAEHKREVEAKRENKKDKKRVVSREEEDEEEEKFRQSLPIPPKIEDVRVEIAKTEPPMYFTQPSQIMDIFAALEEQNLFLIQNSQDTQYTLDELRQNFKETKLTMDARTGQLQQQIDDLHAQISIEEQQARTLHLKRAIAMDASETKEVTSGDLQVEKERLLEELNAKVRTVYEQVLQQSASSDTSTLFMLSQLEGKLEVLLAEIEAMPVDYVIKSEKQKEKVRRERKREEQQALQERQQEERNRRAIERSLQAPKKRTGRQVMCRSRPVRKEFRSTNDDNKNDGNNDDAKFLS